MLANSGPPRPKPTSSQRYPGVGARPIRRSGMTIAELYRAEAARCRDRAEKASTPERVTRWRRLAEDNLRLATELEAADASVHSPASSPSSRASSFRSLLKG